MKLPLLTVRICYEDDVVACRQRARQVAEALGFDPQQQTRLATAVSEIARNAFHYAGEGKAEFFLEGNTAPQLLRIRISDEGRGIPNLNEILQGEYPSTTGMGLGMIGAKRLMDQFTVLSSPGNGTAVLMGKLLPRRSPFVGPEDLPGIAARLEDQKPRSVLDDIREQNHEMLQTLEELRSRQQELVALNRELDDTNRGVVALYAELDEKADHLRRADEIKSRFLSNMSHEFRTPLNSILALSRLLLDEVDGDLNDEQEVQIKYIRKSAESLLDLVNDLLDLAKVEAGKTVIHPGDFEVSSLFGALRGMLRPLLLTKSLDLVFEENGTLPPVFSDEGKISQILRNFISNALKFTEEGEVRVSAWEEDKAGVDQMVFRVRDTGIGIAAGDHEAIFQEFAQLDTPLQRKVHGTGLGLPLSRKLAQLLGGSVWVESEPGAGSSFYLRVPRIFNNVECAIPADESVVHDQARLQVLLVEDDFETRLIYGKYLRDSPWQTISARSVREAHGVLNQVTPAAIILDILLSGEEDAWHLLAELKSEPATRKIPIIVATSAEDRMKALALGADAFLSKPISRADLTGMLRELTHARLGGTVLLVDDEEVARYVVRQVFNNPRVHFLEATNGSEALRIAAMEKPDLVITDLTMPDMDGLRMIEQMASDEYLKDVPVIVATGRTLTSEQSRSLSENTVAILPKSSFSENDIAERLHTILSGLGLEKLLGESTVPEVSVQ